MEEREKKIRKRWREREGWGRVELQVGEAKLEISLDFFSSLAIDNKCQAPRFRQL